MEQEQLLKKYADKEHWKDHSVIYAEEFSDFLKNKDIGGKLIDLGCGSGRDVEVFYDAGFDALGVDISREEIGLAKSEFSDCKFEVGDVENLDLKNDSVSAVFVINVIHYVKKQKAVEEIFRILSDGGYCYIHFNLSVVDENGNIDYFDSKGEIMELVSKFEVIQKEIFNRVDVLPIKHTHKILKLILRKNE